MRARSTWLTAIALLVIGGCNAGLPAFGDGTAPPRAPTRPPVTVAPTLASGATAVPSATAAPAPAASPTRPPDVRTPNYGQFRKHVDAADRKLEKLGQAFMRDIDRRNMQAAVETLQPLREWAVQEIEWLAGNQPRPCYVRLHEVWTSFVTKGAEAFELLNVSLDPIDEPAVRRAVAMMNAAATGLRVYKQSPGFQSGADFDC